MSDRGQRSPSRITWPRRAASTPPPVSSIPSANRDRNAFTPIHGEPVHHAYASDRHDDAAALQMALQEAGLTCRAGVACGIAPLARLDVTVRQGKKGAYLTGLARCRSVNGCAACREDKWTALRREFKAVFDLHIATGGIVRLLTLTSPHRVEERLVWVLRDMLKAWEFFKNSRAARDLKQRGAFFRRVLEVVHGDAHGWHPHFHVPIFLPAMADDEEERVVTKLRAAWVKALKRASGGTRVPLARHPD